LPVGIPSVYLLRSILGLSRHHQKWPRAQLNEKSLADAFLVRKADEVQVEKIEAIVKEALCP